ncbi:hypothetical protein L1887_21025 [Cichorium endivia]|nr:hypothetical protein L1887_21025 [Cichorium endivia]
MAPAAVTTVIGHRVRHQLWEAVQSSDVWVSMENLKEAAMGSKVLRCRAVHNSVVELRNICNHPYLSQLHKEQVVLFSTNKRLLDVMEDYLYWKQYKYLRLDGHTHGGDRGSLIDQFNKPGSPFFIFLLR